MKIKSTRIQTSIRSILHEANRRLQNFYDEFADILDTDEDRLSLQYNSYAQGRVSKWNSRKRNGVGRKMA